MSFDKQGGLAVVAALFIVVSGCSGSKETDVAENPADLRAELLQTDRDFSELAFAQGLEKAYAQFIADDAVQLPDSGAPLSGKQEILENVQISLGDLNLVLSWEPEDAQVSASGDLGYTWGYYYLEVPGENGETVSDEGKYASVWRRTPAGWRVVLDVSNQNEPVYPVELEFDEVLDTEPATSTGPE